MSAATATLYGAIIAGTFALLGLVAERLLRSSGRLWCEPCEWDLHFYERDEYGEARELPPGQEERAVSAGYSASLDLFNGKEIPVGLRDISIEIHGDHDEGVVISKPWKRGAGRIVGSVVVEEPLSLVNLQPRQWVRLELKGDFGGSVEDVRRLARWSRVEFVGQRQRRGLFKNKTYRKTIAET